MFHRPYRLRMLLVLAGFCAAILGLIARLYQLQIVRHDVFVRQADSARVGSVPVLPKRGSILDRNQHELAVSSLRETLYADTSKIPDTYKEDIAIQLAGALDEPATRVLALLKLKGHPPLARTMDPEIANRAHRLLLADIAPKDALYFVREPKRQHPKGRLASHTLGFTTFDHTGDNQGLAGLEFQYDKTIRGNFQKFKALRDARLRQLTPLNDQYYSAAFGNRLILTLDESIQHVAETVLRETIAKYRAKRGAIVVQATKTGEILASASWPDFEPDAYGKADPEYRKDRVIGHAFGMGSVMKTFTAAAAIETGVLTNLDESINCHGGVWTPPPRRRPIRDAPEHRFGWVPFRDVFRFSSNCGTVEVALRMEPAAYYRVLHNFGLGRKTGIDLPGESPGILRPVSQWTGYSMLALPYGGEMSVTPIQLVTGVSAVANGGLLLKPSVVKEIRTYEGEIVQRTEPQVVRRVISPVTSRLMLQLMEDVVGHPDPQARGGWNGGTGDEARIPGYRVGGKTGTFKYIDNPTSYTATFVGVLPLPDPDLTILCVVDDPDPRIAKYGGAIAAPAFKKVAENALRILGIPPKRTDRSPAILELTLQRLRNTGPTARTTAGRGQMPDLRGLTMREVAREMSGLSLRPAWSGSGVVIEQAPAPLAGLQGAQEYRLVFGRPDIAPPAPAPAPVVTTANVTAAGALTAGRKPSGRSGSR